jgi:predicted O-methyltransferase YrrM
MLGQRVLKELVYIGSPSRWVSAARNPRLAVCGFLTPILKHPVLYSRTRKIQGLITPEVGVLLYESVLAAKHESPNVVEAGAYQGLSTTYLAAAAAKANKRVKVVDWFAGLSATDPELDPRFVAGALVSDAGRWEANLKMNGLRGVVDLTIGDARETMLPALRNQGFALAFLDVDLYEVTRDLLFQLASVASGGETIIVHDADSPGIKKAISEFRASSGQPWRGQFVAGGFTAKLSLPRGGSWRRPAYSSALNNP